MAWMIGLLAPIVSAQAQWTSIGPGGGGWLWSLTVAPDAEGTIYVGCDVGGVYRSRDHGQTWQIINRGLGNCYVAAVAVDPRDPRTVYAGTHGGVHKSTDGGDTWTMQRSGFPEIETWGISAPVSVVAIDPQDSRHVLAGIGEPRSRHMPKEGQRAGIYASHDAAETWEFVAGGTDLAETPVYSIAFAADRPATVLAATALEVYRSDDGGATWAKSSEGLPSAPTWEIAADAKPGVFYATFADADAKTGGVARSDDYGRTWQVVRSAEERDWDYWRIVTDPQPAGVVYASVRSGWGIFRSTDGGATWARVTREGNVRSAWFGRGFICTALAIDPRDPRRLYYANDMDIYGTSDAGEAWAQMATDEVSPATPDQPARWRGRGIETTCSSCVAVAPGFPNLIYLGYWDTGLWRSMDGGRSFSWVTEHMGYGKASAIAIDPQRPSRAWLAYGSNYGPHRLWRTDDYGRDWKLVGYEDTCLPPGAVWSLAVDPSSSIGLRRVIAPVNGQGVFCSEDGGETWARIDSGLGENLEFTNLVLDPRDPQRVFVGIRFGRKEGQTLRGGVWRSEDGGRSWSAVADIPERPYLAIAPSDPNVIYAGERDYSSLGRGGVYRSTDGGGTWQPMAERLDEGFGNTPRSYIARVAVDPRDANVAYATSVDEGYDLDSGKGVFVSRDGGAIWRAMNEGLSRLNALDLLIDPNDPDRLYAGTGGNGFFVWGPPAPEGPPPPPLTDEPPPPDPVCTTVEGWTCSAEKLHEITAHSEAFHGGRGYVIALMDTDQNGCHLVKRFAEPVDLSGQHILSLRLRGTYADGTPLCISRMVMRDGAGRRLLYERDLLPTTTWTLYELPLRDWEGAGFDRTDVREFDFEFWAPYPEAKPYELAVGAMRFR
jgi:photosystem II stability/assembly factor-like uncharacterized protein